MGQRLVLTIVFEGTSDSLKELEQQLAPAQDNVDMALITAGALVGIIQAIAEVTSGSTVDSEPVSPEPHVAMTVDLAYEPDAYDGYPILHPVH